MPKSGTIIGAITEELGELGKKVATETAKAPVDIAAAVFEKGASGQKPQQPVQPTEKGQEPQKKEKTPIDFLNEAKTQKEKQGFARDVLKYMRSKKEQPKPSVYEKKIMEEREKKERKQQRAKAAAWQQLPNTGARRRGDLRGIAQKQAGSDTGKNIKLE